jgi:hypothetical protein
MLPVISAPKFKINALQGTQLLLRQLESFHTCLIIIDQYFPFWMQLHMCIRKSQLRSVIINSNNQYGKRSL